MTSAATFNGVIWKCRCGQIENGCDDDTLFFEEYLENAHSNMKHQVFMENAPHDLAANIILLPCPKCRLIGLTLVHVGDKMTTMLICKCGYKTPYNNYENPDAVGKSAVADQKV